VRVKSEKVLTVRQAADRAGVSTSAIYKAIRLGNLPSYHSDVGKKIFILVDDVDKFKNPDEITLIKR
jgi:excisionase family DNA binding protein